MIENTVDPSTGMVTIRATMPNKDEVLWPGTLVTTDSDLAHRGSGHRSVASRCRPGRRAPYVFVVKDGAAQVRPVKVARTVDQDSVIAIGPHARRTSW